MFVGKGSCYDESEKSTADIFKTSAGVGHHWRSPYYTTELSGELAKGRPIDADYKKAFPYEFETTYGTEFPQKYNPRPSSAYKRAPGHWKVEGIDTFVANSRSLSARPGLTHLYKKSVSNTDFCAQSEPEKRPEFDFHFCKTHLERKPVTKLPDELSSKLDHDLVKHLDPYQSVTHFTHSEINPKDMEPLSDKVQMRDFGINDDENSKMKPNEYIASKVLTKGVPQPAQARPVVHPVPHTGWQSTYMNSYEVPQDARMASEYFTARPNMYFKDYPSLSKQPDIRKTEYMSMEKCRRNLV